LATLLDGEVATVTVYADNDTPEAYTVEAMIDVDLDGLRQAFKRAYAFENAIFNFDAQAPFPTAVCTLHVDRSIKRITYTLDEDYDATNTSWAEIVRGPRGEGNCPSYVTLAYLTPDITPAQREVFCLVYDEDDRLLGFQEGERDARRVCKAPSRSFCERVNASKEAALAITGFAGTTVGTAVGTATVTGTTVVAHSSGAAILTGSAGYVAGTLGTIGTTILGLVTAPATIAATTVSVVVVGGAVYLCSE